MNENISPKFAASASENELRRVAKECLGSKQKFSFVIGPPRSGKSTWLPYILAKEGGRPVICVQPDGNVAKRHAEYLRHICGETTSIGFCEDPSEIPDDFEVKDEVTYMSSTWLYRLVMAAQDRKMRSLTTAKPETNVCAIILDEVHAQTMYQELGYVGVHGVVSGILKLPAGWSGETKIILTTAHPQADPFQFRFRLSQEQIERMTLHISVEKPEKPGSKIKEVFLEDGTPWRRSTDYHRNVVAIAQNILRRNNKANVLAIVLKGNHVGSNVVGEMKLEKNTPIFDLSEVDIREVNKRGRGGCVIVAEAEFASRIPVNNITDVICPRAVMEPSYKEEVCKDVTMALTITRWEIDFLKSYLDPAQAVGYIHYAFPREVDGEEIEQAFEGPRFIDTDCVEYWLGLARLVGVERSLKDNTPVRWLPRLDVTNRAITQLESGYNLLYQKTIAFERKLVPSRDLRSKVTFGLMDRVGLDLRTAQFLGHLVSQLEQHDVSTEHRSATILIGILISVFDNAPVLRKIAYDRPAPLDNLVRGDALLFPGAFTSDAWNNAVFWMSNVSAFEAEGYLVLQGASKYNWSVDRKLFAGAKNKIGLLVEHFGIRPSWMVKVTDGSFLKHIVDLMEVQGGPLESFDTNPFFNYQNSYMYNLMWFSRRYFTESTEHIDGRDISSMKIIRVDIQSLTIDLRAALRRATEDGLEGFYACASRHVVTADGVLAQGITILPIESVVYMMDLMGEEGWDLDVMLRLKLQNTLYSEGLGYYGL